MGYKNLGHKTSVKSEKEKAYALGQKHGGVVVDKGIPPSKYAGHPKINQKHQKHYEKGFDDFLDRHEVEDD